MIYFAPNHVINSSEYKQKNMKNYLFTSALTIMSALSMATIIHAQTTTKDVQVTKTTTTASGGTITEIIPQERIIVTVDNEPMTYHMTEETIVVDQYGRIVERSILESGAPATVEYRMIENRPVAVRVVAAPIETGTTILKNAGHTVGTVVSYTPGETVIVRTKEAPEPVSYTWTEETVVIGPDGSVIQRDMQTVLREDTPTRVHYRTVEGRQVIDRVIILPE